MIAQDISNAFRLDLFQTFAKDVFRIALYHADADLSRLTTEYTTKGEVIGSPGYQAGGQILTGTQIRLDGDVLMMGWANNPLWPKATITARGALIYNFSKQNRAVATIDLGPSPTGDPRGWSSTNGNFLVTLPEFTPATALIRWTNG